MVKILYLPEAEFVTLPANVVLNSIADAHEWITSNHVYRKARKNRDALYLSVSTLTIATSGVTPEEFTAYTNYFAQYVYPIELEPVEVS